MDIGCSLGNTCFTRFRTYRLLHFLVKLHWYILCFFPGRSCPSEHSKISQQGLVCSEFQLSLWESLFSSFNETAWMCDPPSSRNGKTDGDPHDRYDQWEWRHPRVHPGPGRLGKYVGAPGLASHLPLIPGTPIYDSFCKLETKQENGSLLCWKCQDCFCHGKGEYSEAQPVDVGLWSHAA